MLAKLSQFKEMVKMPWWTAPSERSWNDEKQFDIKKLVLLNLPYLLMGLFATNFGEAWRLAQGANASEKFLSLFAVLPGALQSFWPSLHPLDLLAGLCCGAGLRLAVYLKSKTPRSTVTAWSMVRPAGEPVRILHLTLILYFRTM